MVAAPRVTLHFLDLYHGTADELDVDNEAVQGGGSALHHPYLVIRGGRDVRISRGRDCHRLAN